MKAAEIAGMPKVGGDSTFQPALTPFVLFLRWVLRFGLWLLTHSFYRIRAHGTEHLPDKGGVLLVCNHLSLVDALLLMASTPRFVRFLMYRGIYERPLIKPLARIMGVIPISSE